VSPPKEEGGGWHPHLPKTGSAAASSGNDTTGVQGQADLFAYAREMSERARDTGLQTAERNDHEWADAAYDWIAGLEAGTPLTADDVRSALGPSSAVGSVFRKASRDGLIACIGMAESRAISRRAGLTRRWVRT